VERGANPELVNALFSLESPGDISAPFLTEAGWMCVQLLQTRDSDADANATTARPWLLERLAARQAGEAQAEALAALRAGAAVEVNQDALAQFNATGDPDRPRRYAAEALTNEAARLLNDESLAILRSGPTPAPSRMALVGPAPQPETDGSANEDAIQEIEQ
jgi:parvulin-like peptidyl-prolyl isomerase